MFCYENKLTFSIYVSDQTFENSMDLLLVIDENKSQYVYIKYFDRFCFTKQRTKKKNTFAKVIYSVFALTKHKEFCLSINGAQLVRLEKGTTEFKNYSKQIPVPFKIFVDFECNLTSVESYEGSYSKNYHDHIPCSLAYKLVCVDGKFSQSIVDFRDKNAAHKFVQAILKGYKYCRKGIIIIIKKN